MLAWVLAMALGGEPVEAGVPEPPLLEWRAHEGCPDQAWIDARLFELIPGERAASLVARAEVTRVGTRDRLRVEMVSATGTSVRELEADGCGVLADAAVFIVAVAIDPAIATAVMEGDAIAGAGAGAGAEAETAAETEAVDVERRAAAEPVEAIDVSPSPAARPRVAGAVRAGFGVGAFEVSRLDLAPSLWGAVRGRYWRAEIGARYVAGRPRAIADSDARLALDGVGGIVRGCGVAPAGPLEIPLCAGVDLTAVRGRPSGVDAPRDRFALRVAIDVAAALAWPLTRRVALWVEASGGFAVLRPQFVVTGRTTPIHLGTVASFAALLGVELRFGPDLRAR